MSIVHGSSLAEIAFEVCTALDAAGITAVLTGGGAATVHAPEAIQSYDLDFILQFMAASFPPDEQPLIDLGFFRKVRSAMYRHLETRLTVEFPPGPLAVGDDLITQWQTLRRNDRVLYVLSPTDSVRDRLAATIHYRDSSSLEQAVSVARLHDIDLPLVEAWCAREGGSAQFAAFLVRLGAYSESESGSDF